MNYYQGRTIRSFKEERTDGVIAESGGISLSWDNLKLNKPKWCEDEGLIEAGKQYSKLIKSQHDYFETHKVKNYKTYADKVYNYAIMASWAFIAGHLQDNPIRLNRHYKLSESTKKDPLNAAVLASARHKSDPENYRGLGTRTDAKERGRLIELFYLQAESGEGIDKRKVELALRKYHAKQAYLDVKEFEES